MCFICEQSSNCLGFSTFWSKTYVSHFTVTLERGTRSHGITNICKIYQSYSCTRELKSTLNWKRQTPMVEAALTHFMLLHEQCIIATKKSQEHVPIWGQRHWGQDQCKVCNGLLPSELSGGVGRGLERVPWISYCMTQRLWKADVYMDRVRESGW